MDKKLLKSVVRLQRNEITEYYVYSALAKQTDGKNSEILQDIARAEREHAIYWQERTGVKVKPNYFKIALRIAMTKLLGFTFVLKLMEKNEGTGSKNYLNLSKSIPESKKISEEESAHEKELLNMLDEEKLRYTGSIVLGLNDALVELTGALAGFTLALGDTKLISIAGLVTGISAALSMAASNYLACKTEGNLNAVKSALYTGLSYIITVFLMILPYFLIRNKFLSLGITLSIVLLIIFFFNYYISIAKDLNFKHRFFEMSFISLGIAAFSFFLGWILKLTLGIEI